MNSPILEYYEKQLQRSMNWLHKLTESKAPKKIIKRAEITVGLWQGRISCVQEELGNP